MIWKNPKLVAHTSSKCQDYNSMLKSLKMADQVGHLVGSVKRITVYTVSLTKSSSGCFCFNDLVSLIIPCRLITLWCLKASFSTEKVTFSPLLSHCLVFVFVKEVMWVFFFFVVTWALRCGQDGILKRDILTGWTGVCLAVLVFRYQSWICLALFWKKGSTVFEQPHSFVTALSYVM